MKRIFDFSISLLALVVLFSSDLFGRIQNIK